MDQKKYIKDVLFAHVEDRDDIIVEKNTRGNKESGWSKRLWKKGNVTPTKNEREELIKDIIFRYFGIDIDKSKEGLLKNAILGQGNEWKTITTLHSSSLCAFLHFCNVSKKSPVEIELKEGGRKVTIVFDKVWFEYQMPCIGAGKSSMDVVLQSEDKKTVLFLESKFSEYFSQGKFDKEVGAIEEYKAVFEDMFDGKSVGYWNIAESMKASVHGNHLIFDNKGVYNEGIKQIICHDIAIHNFQESSGSELFEPANIENYWFSEILFEFENPEERGFKPSQKFDAYRNSSKQLIQRLRQTEKKWCDEGEKTIHLHFNEDPLIYNKVFEKEKNQPLLTKEVKTFYKYAKGE